MTTEAEGECKASSAANVVGVVVRENYRAVFPVHATSRDSGEVEPKIRDESERHSGMTPNTI
jgi:hypothetical protein